MKSSESVLSSWFWAVVVLVLVVVALPAAASEYHEANEQIQADKDAEMTDWTFDQAENVACITVRQVIEDGAPVLLVFHDGDDHSWQFLSGGPVTEDDAMVVSMRQVVDLDPTLLEVGHMPPGYQATRQSVGVEWQIEKLDD